MEPNRYASYLDGRPAALILETTPLEIERLAAIIGPTAMATSPAPGKWSPAQIIAHLADTDLAFGYRLRQTLAQDPTFHPGEPQHIIQPFDQDRWAITYGRVTAQQSMAAFNALRNWNLIFLRNAPAEAMKIPVTHPERGPMTFQTIVETLAGHDINHLQQLEKLATQ